MPSFQLGTHDTSKFRPQFPGAHTGGGSFACSPIVYFGKDGMRLSNHASGFFYRRGPDIFFVSALHCFSGKDAFTGIHISPLCFEPDEIEVFVSLEGHRRQAIRINLVSDEEPKWLFDPDFDSLRTDIAAIKIVGDWSNDDVFCVNDQPEEGLLATIGAEVFVCGYPSQDFAYPYAPIWRRGSFAYEPGLPLDGKPIFLVDAHVSKGMSGSAIFQRWFGPAPIQRSSDIELLTYRIVTQRFVGVYGGRVQDQATGPIGYGWYANRLENIIDQSSDNYEFLSPFRNARNVE